MIGKYLLCALYAMAQFAFNCSAQYFSNVAEDSMALVKSSVACVRTLPGHSQELSSQIIMGTPVKILSDDGGWYLVETPEGYKGYVIHNGLQKLNAVEYNRWRNSKRVFVIGVTTSRIRSLANEYPVSDVFSGSILKLVEDNDSCYIVETPDHRQGWLLKSEAIDLCAIPELNIDSMINRGMQLTGVSYLWGGTTPAAIDCSGFVKILYLSEGVILRRDASQQALTGTILSDDYTEYKPGDLVFFKSAKTGNIVHVGMYIGNSLYIHSSGRVRINSLNPDSNLFIRSNILAGGSRIRGMEDTSGITRIISHPWFINAR